MISWFNSWAQGIILAVIIVTILEMIVPEGKNKKYIKIVMGVYITFTIISPIITKVTGNNFELDVSKYEDLFNSNSVQGANEITSINNQSIENLYLNTIKTDIKTELDNEGYESKKINITADINVENEEAKIYKIDIEVTKKQNEKDIKKVNKVEIGNSTDESNIEDSNLSSGEVNKLKEVLAEKYEIEKEKIYINGK
jgi:stage III sporulation protein AF